MASAGDTAERPFGPWTATALVVGTLVGAGIFVLPAQLAPLGWTAAGAWAGAGCGVLIVAWLLSRLTARWPEAPGALAICGRVLGPLPSVVIGWSYWVCTWSSNAVLAVTAARYLASLIPGHAVTDMESAVGASVILWVVTLLNLRGQRVAGRFQVLTTLLKLVPLLAVLAIIAQVALATPDSFGASPLPAFAASELTGAVTLAFFALIGFETASLVAERVRDPARNVVRATLWGVAVTLAIYLVVSMGIMLLVPSDTLAQSGAPLALFVEQAWGRWAGVAVALFASISAIGCLNGLILLQGEVPLTMVRGGELPRWVAPTNRHDVAALPMMVGTTLACALVLLSATRSGADLLDFMLRLTTAATIWFYIGVCATALVSRIAPPVAVAGLAFCAWVLYGAGLEAGLLGVALMVPVLPLYWMMRRDPAPIT
jgi:APA family basic amino acid/polyamine antiporter